MESGKLQGLLRAVTPNVRPPTEAPTQDLSGYDLGRPLAIVEPSTTQEVVDVVGVARDAGISLVPVGLRTGYWRPLNQEGSVLVSLKNIQGQRAGERPTEPRWFGAGTPIRDVEVSLRQTGGRMACHPDSYGDTSIGSMVSAGFSSGCGIGTTGLDGLVAGLEVVTGNGDILITGTAGMLGYEPFMRPGLPDPTGLFAAADGALGLVTAVAVRPWLDGYRARLTLHLDPGPKRLAQLAEIAATLRMPGYLQTFRAVAMTMPGDAAGLRQVDLDVGPTLTRDELVARIAHVQHVIERVLGQEQVEITEDAPGGVPAIASWWEGEGGAQAALQGQHLLGLDVNVAFGDFEAALQCMEGFDSACRGLPWTSARSGVYFGSDHVNIGCHVVVAPRDAEERAACEVAVTQGMEALEGVDAIPYRWGRLWGPVMRDRLSPPYLELMRALKDALDPHGILHPGAAIWG